MSVPERFRQAVVIVHGMGEQRPLEMLNRFIKAALPGANVNPRDDDAPVFYSRPEEVTHSYESRRYLAPGTEQYDQTEFFEYHWAHLMQGNQLSDLWTTFRRMLFQPPWTVPKGMRGIWCIFWVLIIAAFFYFWSLDIEFGVVPWEDVVRTLAGTGLAGTALTWLLTKILPGKINASFVDVVRYLDTSPRSYAVRREIRKGMVEMLQGLHDTGRYQRVIVVAHSLGAYIAYDGITSLWVAMNQEHDGGASGQIDPTILKQLEDEAQQLLAKPSGEEPLDNPSSENEEFRKKQPELWQEIRKQGCPWLITDFVTVGTPMYMADQLISTDPGDFGERVVRRQLPVCPPRPDLPGSTVGKTLYSYPYGGAQVLYHGAPFAVTRWTNMWFPARFGFFGDWFGGPLAPLFGRGIADHELEGNKPKRFLPAWAHALYFSFPEDVTPESVTTVLREALDLKR
ncbi:MAG: hypothetical protein AAF543_13620 [Pseudomonadota bacterium]